MGKTNLWLQFLKVKYFGQFKVFFNRSPLGYAQIAQKIFLSFFKGIVLAIIFHAPMGAFGI